MDIELIKFTDEVRGILDGFAILDEIKFILNPPDLTVVIDYKIPKNSGLHDLGKYCYSVNIEEMNNNLVNINRLSQIVTGQLQRDLINKLG